MDDWVILATRRHLMRRAIRRENQTLSSLKVVKHPDRTWTGRFDRGFDYLGYHHTRAGLVPTQETIRRFRQRLTRLYEQDAGGVRTGTYRKRWWRWVTAGLKGCEMLIEQRRNTQYTVPQPEMGH